VPTSQQHIGPNTPLGATLVGGGATFRAWAPRASAVYVITDELPATRSSGWQPKAKDLLVQQADGTWAGFVPGLSDGSPYRFWVVGDAAGAFKRDPYARELGTSPPYPDCDCLVRAADSYPWHDAGWRPPDFSDLIIYQFHVGTYFATDAGGADVRPRRSGTFLDLLDRIEYWRDLGITAIQLLPIEEYPTETSQGYNGTDYFSPEMDYQVESESELRRYLATANRLRAARGQPGVGLEDIRPGPNQLKLVVDLCHLHGIAVLFDVVYNHAGSGNFDPQSLYFFDRKRPGDNNDSLYFTDQSWAGGLIFAYWNQWVRQYLIDNAAFHLGEFHGDGLRYDEVRVIEEHGGWSFAQDLTGTLRFLEPEAVQIAEYWKDPRRLAVTPAPEGLGFDAALSDRLRDALRSAVGQASWGAAAPVSMDAIASALLPPPGFPAAWRAVHCVENHDVVLRGREPRLPWLANQNERNGWYARSRSRFATGLLLTAPGVPHLFMGQELLEDKPWSDDRSGDTLIWWDGLAQDPARRDFLAFTRDMIGLRRRLPALRSGGVNPFHVHNDNRVLAVHRWVEGVGQDVVVVASLAESTFWSYQLGLPVAGRWREILNSDVYDSLPNPAVAGNGGAIVADGPPRDGFGQSAQVVIPANAVVVFARE
jgi:1,4-alpha-glucan branching enzyme